MTYVPGHRRRGLGDDETTTPLLPTLPGSAGPLGIGLDPGALLTLQVNRFAGPSVPSDLRVLEQPYPVASGAVPEGVAVSAIFVIQKAALDAAFAFKDRVSGQAFDQAVGHLGDAGSYVNANVALVTTMVSQYGDLKGLPKASVLAAVTWQTYAIVGAAALVAITLYRATSRKKGRK